MCQLPLVGTPTSWDVKLFNFRGVIGLVKTSFEPFSKGKIFRDCFFDYLVGIVALVTSLLHIDSNEMKIFFWIGLIMAVASCIVGSVNLYTDLRHNKTLEKGTISQAKLSGISARKEGKTMTTKLWFEDTGSSKVYRVKALKGDLTNHFSMGDICRVCVYRGDYIVETDAKGVPIVLREGITE